MRMFKSDVWIVLGQFLLAFGFVVGGTLLVITALWWFTGAHAQNMSQMGRIADPQQPYTRAGFERECIKMAPKSEPERRKWIARCKHEAP
jgi:hypothetical protein